jgi:chloride channel 3/4/5
MTARKREVLSAASASGISVAFGAPVGGVLFSLESLSYYFPDKTMWQSFVCAMIAAFTLKAVDPFRTGKTVPYSVTYHTGWHGFEMVAYAIIGVLGGLYGGLLIKLNMRLAALRDSPRYPLKGRPILEVCIITIATSVIAFPVTFLRAQASELVYYLFAECKDIQSDPLGLCKSGIANTGVIFLLLTSAIIGFFFTALTFGLQIPAGILLPSMTIGALYGRVIGLIVEVWQREHPKWIVFASCEPDIPCITPGTYAIVGAASALAGATRMTVSIVVIMFELTGALTYVLPIMIAVMIAKWVGDALGKRGIYEAWIAFNEYPFLDNRDDRPIPDIPVSQIMTRMEDLIAIFAEDQNTISSLRRLLDNYSYRGFPVVSNAEDTVLLGFISRTELSFALTSAITTRSLDEQTQCFFSHQPTANVETTLDLRPWMDQTPITLNSAIGLELCVNYFQRLGLRYLGFCDRGVLKGMLTKKDVWFVVNGGDEGGGRAAGAREDEDVHGRSRGVGGGVLREGDEGEERGLLYEGRGGRSEDVDVDLQEARGPV